MGGLSWIHWLLIAGVALVLFGGKGKISDLMGDFGKGVNSFKKGLGEGAKEDPKVINGESRPAEPVKDKDKDAA
jgi:sec-independent protein translocase protein TatA